MNLNLRNADEYDRHLIWVIRNEPEVREASFNTSEIPWEDHKKWYAKALTDPTITMFMIELDEIPIGTIRFNQEDDEATVSIAISDGFRGMNYGTVALQMACEKYLETHKTKIIAYVKCGNVRSTKAFDKAGFTNHGIQIVSGFPSYRLEYNNPVAEWEIIGFIPYDSFEKLMSIHPTNPQP
jgi:RimJ/RimL family protein N-acetyltransferase